jgi:hypothetical protein
MRVVVLAALVGLAIGPLAVRSAAACPDRATAGHEPNIVLAANGCGAGFHWVTAHRDASGHWVPGHCAPN